MQRAVDTHGAVNYCVIYDFFCSRVGGVRRTFFMFSARRSYSSRTSCSSGVSSGGEAMRLLWGRGGGSILCFMRLDGDVVVGSGER